MPNASASDEMRQLRTAFQVLAGGDCHRLRLVRDDHRMRGRVLERYAAVPNIGNPRVLLPLDAAPLAQRAMLQPYVAGTVGLGGRSAARLLRLASRMYLMQPMLRHRLAI